jgi:zinc D-Ala-D-Ala dipeptidase
MLRFYTHIVITVNFFFTTLSFAKEAPRCWSVPEVDQIIHESVLYLPIADIKVKSIILDPINEEIVDLLEINHPRIKPLSSIDKKYTNTYEGFSKIRLGVYKKLLKMLEILPSNLAIAYFEGFRPLWKQKEYFDKKFKEILVEVKDKELAYQETTKHVSPS